jgi:hypothetical protein
MEDWGTRMIVAFLSGVSEQLAAALVNTLLRHPRQNIQFAIQKIIKCLAGTVDKEERRSDFLLPAGHFLVGWDVLEIWH